MAASAFQLQSHLSLVAAIATAESNQELPPAARKGDNEAAFLSMWASAQAQS